MSSGNGVVVLVGRIEASREFEASDGSPTVATHVKLPSESQFDSPSNCEIFSRRKLGKVGETVSVECRIGGRVKAFTYLDSETGKRKTGQEFKHWLRAVE